MEEDIARPPVRIQANASSPLSFKAAQSHVDGFLIDFRARSGPSKGGDAAITAQLHKLSESLKEQRARERRHKGSRWYHRALRCTSAFNTYTDRHRSWVQVGRI